MRKMHWQVLIHFLGRFDAPRKQEVALKALHDLSKHPISAVSPIPVNLLSCSRSLQSRCLLDSNCRIHSCGYAIHTSPFKGVACKVGMSCTDREGVT